MDRQLKQKVKYYLIIANIFLAMVLFTLLLYGLSVIRPNLIQHAHKISQHVTLDLNHLPKKDDTINPDYLGENYLATVEQSTEEQLQKPLAPKPSSKVTAKLSILITNLGLSKKATESALTLPKQIGLGFLPYTTSLKPLIYLAQEKEHEIFLYLPFETNNPYENQGQFSLQTSSTIEENTIKLSAILNSQAKYKGVYSSNKEKFTNSQDATENILAQLQNKNLLFIIGRSPSIRNNNLDYLKGKNGIVFTDIVIDDKLDKEAIQLKLEELAKQAKKAGKALGYAQGYALTINEILNWLPTLDSQGIELVSISSLLEE